MVAIWIRSWNFVNDTFLTPTYRNNGKHAEQCSRTGSGFVQFWFGVTVVDVNDWGTLMCRKNTLPLFFLFLIFFYREKYKKERRFFALHRPITAPCVSAIQVPPCTTVEPKKEDEENNKNWVRTRSISSIDNYGNLPSTPVRGTRCHFEFIPQLHEILTITN